MQGKSTRTGLYKCYQCRKQFTVRGGNGTAGSVSLIAGAGGTVTIPS